MVFAIFFLLRFFSFALRYAAAFAAIFAATLLFILPLRHYAFAASCRRYAFRHATAFMLIFFADADAAIFADMLPYYALLDAAAAISLSATR